MDMETLLSKSHSNFDRIMWPNEPFDLLAQRHRTNDFRWATRDWNGSPYFVRGEAKSPKEIVKAVLESPSVAKVLVKVRKDT